MKTILRFIALSVTLFVTGTLSACAGEKRTAAPEMKRSGDTALTTETAIFAGGCFWCMEPPFDHVKGVLSTTSGYTGGTTVNPTYEQVSRGGTGHAEAVKVVYDPDQVSYETLLGVYWHNIDPFAVDQQFCDHGHQYRSAIFTQGPLQAQQAQKSKQTLESPEHLGRAIATEIVPATVFYPAEEYHQDYYQKNPLRYAFYRYNCGRDARLDQVWGSFDH